MTATDTTSTAPRFSRAPGGGWNVVGPVDQIVGRDVVEAIRADGTTARVLVDYQVDRGDGTAKAHVVEFTPAAMDFLRSVVAAGPQRPPTEVTGSRETRRMRDYGLVVRAGDGMQAATDLGRRLVGDEQ